MPAVILHFDGRAVGRSPVFDVTPAVPFAW
jgi:hypothetical protein